MEPIMPSLDQNNDATHPVLNAFADIPAHFLIEKMRKTYCEPQLLELGDLRSMTLGTSPEGFGDSSGGFSYERIPPNITPSFPPLGGPPNP
jgi:hypothetical protein